MQVADRRQKHKDTKQLKDDQSQFHRDQKSGASATTTKHDGKNVVKDKMAVHKDRQAVKAVDQKDKKVVPNK